MKQFLKDNNQPNRKGNKPILVERVYNLLLERNILQNLPPVPILMEGANALNNLIIALEDFDEQNNHSDNENEN